MKVLTLNTWQENGPWRERWEVVVEGLLEIRPEFVGFQELFNESWAKEIQKTTGFPTLLFPKKAHTGLVIYAQYAVTSWGVERLAQSPLENYGRYLLWSKAKSPKGEFYFLCTHLSWKPEDGATRRIQVEEIVKFIEKKDSKAEWIMVGDLNAPPDSPEIKWLIENGRFRDIFAEKHPNETAYTWDNKNPYAANAEHKMQDRRIDYILARGLGPVSKNPVSCDLVFIRPTPQGVWASDHIGVLAEFQ